MAVTAGGGERGVGGEDSNGGGDSGIGGSVADQRQHTKDAVSYFIASVIL